MLSSIWSSATLGWLIYSCVEVRAETAVCSHPNYAMYTNTLHQDPCLVASNLMNGCPDSSGIPVQALQQNSKYIGAGSPNECVCNTVSYSELYVCAFCQGGSIQRWAEWSKVCTKTYDTYPRTLPFKTNVQSWAYNRLTVNGTIDNDAILADLKDGGFKEAVGPISAQTSTQASSSSSTASSFASPSTTTTQITRNSITSTTSPSTPSATGQNGLDSGNSGSKNVGAAIAGGTVGGVVVFAAAIVAIFFCHRRKRQLKSPGPVVGADSSSSVQPIRDSSSLPPAAFHYYSGAPEAYEPAPGMRVNLQESQSVPTAGYAVPEVSPPYDYGRGNGHTGITTVYNQAPAVIDGQLHRYTTTANRTFL